MAIMETTATQEAATRLRSLLARARELKPVHSIDPPLPYKAFSGSSGLPSDASPLPPKPTQLQVLAHQLNYQSVENAARGIFFERLSTSLIRGADFVEVWNLLDIVNICGDQGQCDPSLVWWLIEELLDSQEIDGCRVVFDYLESRRARLIETHFKHRHLVVLRACNELLRRLSRAEEAVFCGRIFMFLFQGFPLGERSSVNPKGEFHKENVTTYESEPSDSTHGTAQAAVQKDVEMTGVSNSLPSDVKEKTPGQTTLLGEDELYPIFWQMQEAFSNPPDYFFKDKRTEEFKRGLEATLDKFIAVPKVNQAAASESRSSNKRSAQEMEHEEGAGNTFNPKYLTSKELFSLELSDLAFQRHIVVQALILLDFLLSLTERAKRKLVDINPQKALQYDFTLSEQDTEWAEKMKRSIATYLSPLRDTEGLYYHRMVNTVLSRDKNWVRWKLENCPQITREPVRSEAFALAREGSKSACAAKRLRPSALGSLNLDFLVDRDSNASSTQQLNETARIMLPNAEALVKEVQMADLDMDFAVSVGEKQQLQESKTSKTWRALRLASKTRLSMFDQVDDGRNLQCLVVVQPQGSDSNIEGGEHGGGGDHKPVEQTTVEVA
ncbi:NAD/NADP-dependent betaine aldehyde dehydrogenase [Venturia nashicola]|uniref:NAD/NADP-dependent betaine aldehyde dehydrogenase n=1 Tax=Venturia nashicola TaxID=86259 RepID=A0A4Z1PIQ3_9PEZI|nr:NAD/NADP-dependent betaine aldehyde dehydrogenase [Venturia nashicola]